MTKCPECKGLKIVKCPHCNGKGKKDHGGLFSNDWRPCKFCGSTGKLLCNACGGKGEI